MITTIMTFKTFTVILMPKLCQWDLFFRPGHYIYRPNQIIWNVAIFWDTLYIAKYGAISNLLEHFRNCLDLLKHWNRRCNLEIYFVYSCKRYCNIHPLECVWTCWRIAKYGAISKLLEPVWTCWSIKTDGAIYAL